MGSALIHFTLPSQDDNNEIKELKANCLEQMLPLGFDETFSVSLYFVVMY